MQNIAAAFAKCILRLRDWLPSNSKPSFYLVAKDDKMIPPPAQQAMASRCKAKVTELPGSHAIYVSKAKEVAEFIEQAATV